MDDATRREKADALLAADPRVAEFAIGEADGSLDIVIAPMPDWVAAERAAAQAATIKKWEMVYDRNYRWDRDTRPPNFDAWTSGFTGEPIPIERMRIWLDDALALMRSVRHKRVIEIGCGVGLVVAALAPGGEAYTGLDLSGEAIASLGAWLATQPELSHVTLAEGAAHEADKLGPVSGSADLAIINSVSQYFPDAGYFKRVLGTLESLLSEGGAVFLGDLRAVALLPLRATVIAATRAEAGATVAQVRDEAAALLGLAREFAIDPAFLGDLTTTLPRLGAITFSLKPEAADHELSGYRYDAILQLDVAREPPAPTALAGLASDYLALLDSERPAAICFSGIANKRVANDVALAREIATAASETLIADLDIRVDPAAVEPHEFAAAAEARGYRAELRFTPGSAEGCFDALLRLPGKGAGWPEAPLVSMPTNDPLGEDLNKRLRRRLQTDLEAAVGGKIRCKISSENAHA